jgi:hypothetical protein
LTLIDKAAGPINPAKKPLNFDAVSKPCRARPRFPRFRILFDIIYKTSYKRACFFTGEARMCALCRFNGYAKDGTRAAPAGLETLQQVVGELIELHKVRIENNALVGQDWRADIERLASAAALTPGQLSLIAARATPTLRRVFEQAASPGEQGAALSHGFQDSLVKILSVLAMRIDGETAQTLDPGTKESVFAYGCALQRCLADNLHNYRLMLPPDGSGPYADTLALYERETLPRLARALAALPGELGLSETQAAEARAAAEENCTAGKEHLHRLPAAQWRAA